MAMDMVVSGGGELDLQSELEETERALREVTLMIEQSQGEVMKLSQRNAAIRANLIRCHLRRSGTRMIPPWMPSSASLSCEGSSRSCKAKEPISNASRTPSNDLVPLPPLLPRAEPPAEPEAH